MRATHLILAFIALILVAGSSGWTQDSTYRIEENPFQDEFDYRVPNELRPAVEVNSVRLKYLRIAPREGKSIVSGKDVQCTLTVEVENVGKDNQNVLVVALLEDEKGRQLQRLDMQRIKVKDGESETATEKHKVAGQILQDTAKIWLFFEVMQ